VHGASKRLIPQHCTGKSGVAGAAAALPNQVLQHVLFWVFGICAVASWVEMAAGVEGWRRSAGATCRQAAVAIEALTVTSSPDSLLLRQVALGVADGGVLLFDIAAAAVTARLSGFRGDVQSLAWARFWLPAPGQPGGSAAGPAAGGADDGGAAGGAEPAGGSSVSPATGADASGAAAAASEHLDALQPASTRLNGHSVVPVIDAERATDTAHRSTVSPPREAAGAAAAPPPGAACDLLAAGARDGSIQIWDCRCPGGCQCDGWSSTIQYLLCPLAHNSPSPDCGCETLEVKDLLGDAPNRSGGTPGPESAKSLDQAPPAQRLQPRRLHELTLPKPGGLSAAQASVSC
jgi:hypothetical protein